MAQRESNSSHVLLPAATGAVSYWRVEGSLLELGALRPVGFVTWNSQSLSERWARRAGMGGMALARPFAYFASRTFATRFLHTLLRGVSRDRLDLLGEEYFHYVLKPQLRREAAEKLIEAVHNGERVVLVGQLLENILRPLAHHCGVDSFVSNRLEFRDGKATWRLLDPIVRPRGPLAWIATGETDGRIPREKLLSQLGWTEKPGHLENALKSTARTAVASGKSVALFGETPRVDRLSARENLANRHLLLIGVTGFIGKVWLVDLLDFLRKCHHAGLMHLSTCYVVGMRDGRVTEELHDNYNPAGDSQFDAQREIASLRETIRRVEERAGSPELDKALRRQALGRGGNEASAPAAELDGVLKRNRARWARNRLVRIGLRRAQHLGWPNTYTFTKSLGESILAHHGRDLPIAIVRPSIVESSERSPFTGWNEGINTSGPLSYLLGTNFRQLPSNERKCLDVIPVDMVSRGMTLIAGALVTRRHARLYQLATSAINPVNMGRSIELTGLAHRKHYRSSQTIENWLKVKFETIPVSKQRYERLSIPMQKAVVSGINRVAATLRLKKAPFAKAERDLIRAQKLIELYEPFILHNEHVFECENARLLSAALPPGERELFDFTPEAVDWWDYWINVHIPALRRWCYPLMEGRPLEAREPRALEWNGNGQPAEHAALSKAAPSSD